MFPIMWILGVAFFIDEMSMRFKAPREDKKRMTHKEKVVDNRHTTIVIKDAQTKYLCAMILKQKHIYKKGSP